MGIWSAAANGAVEQASHGVLTKGRCDGMVRVRQRAESLSIHCD
jgi:hypothetical protein